MKKSFFLFIIAAFIISFAILLGSVFAKESPKVAYITFDDGPTLNTPSIVKTLNKYNAKATFFVLEERIVMYPDYVKDIIHSGHAIGLHGVSHSERIYSSDSSPLEEMEKANKALLSLTGKRASLVRVPYGSSYKLTDSQYKLLCDNGYLLWDWNVDPRDSVGKIYPEKIFSNMRRDLQRCSSTPVILFHDRKSTARMLEDIIKYLQAEGYELAAISEKQTPINHKGDVKKVQNAKRQ